MSVDNACARLSPPFTTSLLTVYSSFITNPPTRPSTHRFVPSPKPQPVLSAFPRLSCFVSEPFRQIFEMFFLIFFYFFRPFLAFLTFFFSFFFTRLFRL